MALEVGEVQYELRVPGSDKPRPEGSANYTGPGLACYENGDTYNGTFVHGLRQGKGVYSYKNGDVYSGHYEENKKHGFGKMKYAPSAGESEDETESQEHSKSLRGGTYLGCFSGGLRGSRGPMLEPGNSQGTFTYANGDTYCGQWHAGKKHGQGAYSYASDGTKLIGEWVKGKITAGQWMFANGTFYCGRFRYNKPFGEGVWTFRNGNQRVGEYVQKEQNPGGEVDAGQTQYDGDEEQKEKPDPEVWCYFEGKKDVVVRGGTMFQQRQPDQVPPSLEPVKNDDLASPSPQS